jgi:hypothetical protein
VFIFYAKTKQSQKTIAFFIVLSEKSDDGLCKSYGAKNKYYFSLIILSLWDVILFKLRRSDIFIEIAAQQQ